MSKPLLSICIPTYNRANFLKTCLGSIVVQFEDREALDQIEVVISDNASTDNTTKIVREFQSKFANIKYFRNEVNLGFDRNVLNVIEKSTGEYCLTIGDDDAFFKDSFSYILNKIKTLKAPYYMINSWGYDHELAHPALSHPNIQTDKDVLYAGLAEYVRETTEYLNLVGSFCGFSHIFHREEWLAYKNKEQYIGTNTIHYYILLSAFKNSKFALLAQPIVKTRSSNIRWESFTGLETASGRTRETIRGIKWLKEKFDLPISNTEITTLVLSREYWFTFKEIVKSTLSRIGLRVIIDYYRKIR